MRLAKHTSRLIKAIPTQGQWRNFRRWQRMNKTQRAEYLRPRAKQPRRKPSLVKRALQEIYAANAR